MSHEFIFKYAKYMILLSAIFGFLYRKKLKAYKLGSFPFYLLLVFSLELTSYILYQNKMYDTSQKMYPYILFPIQILFFFWLLCFRILNNKKLGILLLVLFLGVLFYDIISSQQIKDYIFAKSYSLGSILLILPITIYLIGLSKNKEILYFYHNPLFWISLGLIFYYVFSFPLYAFYNSLFSKYKNVFENYVSVVHHLGIIMYILFIIGIIWSKKN